MLRLRQELYLRHDFKQEVGIRQHVGLNELSPLPHVRLEDVVHRVVERVREGYLRVVGVRAGVGDERGYTGVVVVLEVHSEYLVDDLAGLEALRVQADHSRVDRAELAVEVDADSYRLDVVNLRGQLAELAVQVAVVTA